MDNSINNAEDAKERVMYSKCDNPVITSKSDNIMINDEADEVIKEFFDSVISRYDSSLESIKVVSLSLVMFIYCIINTPNRLYPNI